MDRSEARKQIEARLERDLAAGKTISLSDRDLDDAGVREQLPQLLDQLAQREPQKGSATGPSIPGYTLLGEIGQGGMSTVHLARQEGLDRHVALKLAPAWLGGNERARKMLGNEARAMARLQHPNIVAIHDILDVDETLAIAMEWVDGRTFASLLRRLPPSPSDRDAEVLAEALGTPTEERAQFRGGSTKWIVERLHDISLALHAVHEAGLLHLDVKPSNVLVRRDGTALLADFGVTRDITPDEQQTRTFAGTPVYAAPEQLRRSEADIGPSTDVYSLGMTLYEALARTQPLQGLDLPALMRSVEAGAIPRLSELAQLPADLVNVVHRAISPSPTERYPTAAAFAADLRAFLEHRPVQARPLSRLQRLRRWCRNEPWKAALAATLALGAPVLGGLGVYLAAQLPAIEAAEAQALREQADKLEQAAFQRHLTNQGSDEFALAPLKEAIGLDPDGTTVATLLTLAAEMGWGEVDAALRLHADRIEREPSLRMLRDKLVDRRAFFSPDEVAGLKSLQSAAARYTLALDRFFLAHDEANQDKLEAAQLALEAAAMQDAPDPLLLGLLLWNAARRSDTQRFEQVQDTMWRRWPDDAFVLAWAPLSIEPYDSGRAVGMLEELIQRTPDATHGFEVLAANRMRAGDVDGVDGARADAAATGLSSPMLDMLPLLARARTGTADDARALLEHPRQDLLLTSFRLSALKRSSEQDAHALVEALLTAEDPSPGDLRCIAAYEDAPGDQTGRAVARFFELYPDRRRMHNTAIVHAWLTGRSDPKAALSEVARLSRDVSQKGKDEDKVTQLILQAAASVRDWELLLRHAEGWLATAPEQQLANYYAGLALVRTERFAAGSAALARALTQDPPTRRGRPPSWYVAALLEDAWLRVSPEADEVLADVQLAEARLARFDALNRRLARPHSGPWEWLVRAELAWRRGDRDTARTALERAKRHRRPALPLRDDWRSFLDRAAVRMQAR